MVPSPGPISIDTAIRLALKAFVSQERQWPFVNCIVFGQVVTEKKGGAKEEQESENVQKDPHKSAFIETCECSVRINLCGHNLGILIFISERGELSETMMFIFLYDKKKQGVYVNRSYGLK